MASVDSWKGSRQVPLEEYKEEWGCSKLYFLNEELRLWLGATEPLERAVREVAECRKSLEAIVNTAVLLPEPWAAQEAALCTFCFPLPAGATTGNCALGKHQGRICAGCEVTNNIFCPFASKAANLRKEGSTKADSFLLSPSLPLSPCSSLYPAVQGLQREQWDAI